jgi:hypothetical protein
MMNDEDKRAMGAFLLACGNIRESVKDMSGWDACLALTQCLAECIVFGNSENDNPDQAVRLAQTVNVLGEMVSDILTGVDDHGPDDEEEPGPSPPSPAPDLLRKLLERRRITRG